MQCLWQKLIAKVLWHLKNSDLSNAVSQSPRIQLALNSGKKMPVSKARTGVQSQNSACAEFWSFCTRLLVKQEFPDAKAVMSTERSEWRHLETVVKVRGILSHKDFLGLECQPLAKAKTGKLSKNSALQNSLAFVPLQRKTQCLWQSMIAKAAKALVGMTGFGTQKALPYQKP